MIRHCDDNQRTCSPKVRVSLCFWSVLLLIMVLVLAKVALGLQFASATGRRAFLHLDTTVGLQTDNVMDPLTYDRQL